MAEKARDSQWDFNAPKFFDFNKTESPLGSDKWFGIGMLTNPNETLPLTLRSFSGRRQHHNAIPKASQSPAYQTSWLDRKATSVREKCSTGRPAAPTAAVAVEWTAHPPRYKTS